MLTSEGALAWVERLGGWAVVVWVVWVMLKSQNRLIAGLEGAVDAFRSFMAEEKQVHTDITKTQQEILHEIRQIRGERLHRGA